MIDSMVKLPPQNLMAEGAVIGACLLDGNIAVTKALSIVTADMFYSPTNQDIFRLIQMVHNNNKAVDVITINEEIENNKLQIPFNDLLSYTELVPRAYSLEEYCNIIKSCYLKREVIKLANDLVTKAFEPTNTLESLINDAQDGIFDIANSTIKSTMVHISEVVDQEATETVEAIEQGNIKDKNLIPTGFFDLDNDILNGGLNPSDLITIAARPAMGKTAFVVNLAVNIASDKNNTKSSAVAIFSLEMANKQIVQRVISSETNLFLSKIKNRYLEEKDLSLYISKLPNIKSLPIYLDDKSSATVQEIKSKAFKLKSDCKKTGQKLGAVIIDYLQLMDIETEGNQQNRNNEISKITRGLKKLAKELDVPVIALSQLSRTVEQRANKRPQLSDLRESGSIEQDSDIVIFLYRDEYYNPDSTQKRQAEAIIAKHRNGAIGTVKLFFDGTLTQFKNLEKGSN